MIALLGDIHGAMGRLVGAVRVAHQQGAKALIQLGDFGFDEENLAWLSTYSPEIPVYVIDGNHEHHELLPLRDPYVRLLNHKTTMDSHFVHFVPRSWVGQIDGKWIGFLGGADSVDKNLRLQLREQYKYGGHWSPDEVVTAADCERLLDNAAGVSLDLFLTHGPPQEIIERHFKREDLRMFGLHPSWTSPSALLLDEVWAKLDKPQLYCGHMHREVVGPNYGILDINQLLFLP